MSGNTLRKVASASDVNFNPPPPPPTSTTNEVLASAKSDKLPSTSTTKRNFSVIGPAFGAKFLLSEEVRIAKALAEEEKESNFSIRDLVGVGVGAAGGGKEGSLKELTRRASAEDELIKRGEGVNGKLLARERVQSVNKGIEAGLGSPFESPVQVSTSSGGGGGANGKEKEKEKEKEKRKMPVSGPSAGGRGRRRSDASSGGSSAGSFSKDEMLNQLAEALKKERRRCELYEKEIENVESEIKEVTSNINVMTETHETLFTKQEDTIASLRIELTEVLDELSTAYDLDARDAETYLLLLAPSSSNSQNGSKFAELGLRSDSKVDLATTGGGGGALGGFAKKFRLRKRIDLHLAAREGVDKTKEKEKEKNDGKEKKEEEKKEEDEEVLPAYRRPRKLSKTRRPSISSLIETPPKVVPFVINGNEKGTTTGEVESGGFRGSGKKDGATLGKKEREKKRPPTSGKDASPPPKESGSGTVEVEQSSVRKRTNSFTKIAKGTLRALFPNHDRGLSTSNFSPPKPSASQVIEPTSSSRTVTPTPPPVVSTPPPTSRIDIPLPPPPPRPAPAPLLNSVPSVSPGEEMSSSSRETIQEWLKRLKVEKSTDVGTGYANVFAKD